MYSSNQVLQVSGSLERIETALDFALNMSGHTKTKSKLTYQISNKGGYCIGWKFDKTPEGWTDFPDYYDNYIIAMIIKRYLETQEYSKDPNEFWDGSSSKGFIMDSVMNNLETDDCVNSAFYGIVKFSPFWLFYAK